MVERTRLLRETTRLLKQFPVVALLGARQVGKSTLARAVAQSRRTVSYFDLEHGPDLAKLDEQLARGTFARCDYQMSTPYQGAGTCTFSNGASYQMHVGS